MKQLPACQHPEKSLVFAKADVVFFHKGFQISQPTPHDFGMPHGCGDGWDDSLPCFERSHSGDLTTQFVTQLLPTMPHLSTYDHLTDFLIQRSGQIQSPETINCSQTAVAGLSGSHWLAERS